MPQRLVIMRHARAEHGHGIADHERALAASGHEEAHRVGAWLKAQGYAVDAVLSSTARRTRETAQLVAPGAAASFSRSIYNGWVDDLMTEISLTPAEVRCLLLVGHAPVVAQLVVDLADASSDEAALRSAHQGFATAAVSVLDCHSPWRDIGPKSATLQLFRAPL